MTETATHPHVYRRTTPYLLAAATLTAVAFALFWLASSAASASYGGDGTQTTPEQTNPELPDSDNLDFNAHSIQATHFGVPVGQVAGTGGGGACHGSGVFDGFFTAEDFPVVDGDNVRGSGCSAFVAGQTEAIRQMYGINRDGGDIIGNDGNGGYHLRLRNGQLVLQRQAKEGWYQRTSGPAGFYGSRVDNGGVGLSGNFDLVAANFSGLGARGGLGYQNIGFSIPITTDSGGRQSSYRCAAGSHPRGEDSEDYDTAGGSGRRLNSLTGNEPEIANQHWCRTDARYKQRFYRGSAVSLTFSAYNNQGVWDANVQYQQASGNFEMWGRQGCYWTSFGITYEQGYPVCDYPFALPCPDWDAGQWAALNRDGQPLGTIDCDNPVTPGGCLVPPCDAPDLTPTTTTTVPSPPGIPPPPTIPPPTTTTVPPPTSGPCDSHDFSVAENLIPTSAATPGLSTPRQGADLTVISKNPNNASPPRGAAEPQGCPDGPENRLSPPTSAGFANSTAPPGAFADYAVVRQNLAHRYAARAAAEDCAATRAEAELVLAYVKAEAWLYAKILDETADWADGWIDELTGADGYQPVARNKEGVAQSGSGWLGGYSANYAAQLSEYYTGTGTGVDVDPRPDKTVLAGRVGYARAVKTAAESAAQTLRTSADGWSVSVLSNNCKNGYAAQIGTATSGLIGDFQDVMGDARGALKGFGKPLAEWDRHVNTPVDPLGYDEGAHDHGPAVFLAENIVDNSSVRDGTPDTPAQPGRPAGCPAGFSERDEAHLNLYLNRSFGCFRISTATCLGVRYSAINLCLIGFLPAEPDIPARDGRPASGYCSWKQTATTPTEQELSYRPVNTANGTYRARVPFTQKGTATATRYRSGTLTTDADGSAVCTPGNWGAASWSYDYPASMNPGLGEPARYVPQLHPSRDTYPELHTNYLSVTAGSHQPEDLLHSYLRTHPSRNGLRDSNAAVRASATAGFRPLVGAVPTGGVWAVDTDADDPIGSVDVRQAAVDYQVAYAKAYYNPNPAAGERAGAFDQAMADMGGASTAPLDHDRAWSGFAWRYNSTSLIWGGYEGHGLCDGSGSALLAVSRTGQATVAAARLDYETRQVNGVALPADPPGASCNITRSRTPQLAASYHNTPHTIHYTPGVSATLPGAVQTAPGGDWTLAPNPEHHLFALDLSLKDSRPVLCWADNFPQEPGGSGYVSQLGVATSAGPGIDPVGVAIGLLSQEDRRPSDRLAPAGSTRLSPPPFHNTISTGNDHCGAVPPQRIAEFLPGPEWVWFDDTAHSAMAHVWLSRAVPDCTADMAGSEILDLQTMQWFFPGDDVRPPRTSYLWDSRNDPGQGGFYGRLWSAPTGFTTTGWTGQNNPLIDLGGHLDYAAVFSLAERRAALILLVRFSTSR